MIDKPFRLDTVKMLIHEFYNVSLMFNSVIFICLSNIVNLALIFSWTFSCSNNKLDIHN